MTPCFKSFDGTLFDVESECLAYEAERTMLMKIDEHINLHCINHGTLGVAQYIIDHIDGLHAIVHPEPIVSEYEHMTTYAGVEYVGVPEWDADHVCRGCVFENSNDACHTMRYSPNISNCGIFNIIWVRKLEPK